jgi:carboxypeptidase C (cathepsin A)
MNYKKKQNNFIVGESFQVIWSPQLGDQSESHQ